MSVLKGIKDNFCMLKGVQGVVKTSIYENTSGETVAFSVDNPQTNTLYVFKEYTRGIFGTLPETPTGDFNFKVTLNKSDGFTVSLENIIKLYSTPTTSTTSVQITVKYDNPEFDTTNNYTVLHFYFWYDGINYCCKVDGY